MKKTFVGLIVLLILSVSIVSLYSVYAGFNPISSTVPEIVDNSPQKQIISLNFVGDILPARAIELTMRKQGYDYPFQRIITELENADITFANLESPLIGDAVTGKTTPGGTTVFRGDTAFAAAIKRAGIDIVSLANNHMKDQGQKGIESTLNTLDAIGLAHTGAGLNLDDARKLTIIEIPAKIEGSHPIRVGFLAYNDSDVVPKSYHAGPEQSGTHIMNISELQQDVAAARPQVDVLVISMHSGTEYKTINPNSRQIEFSHAAIDAGADIVVGHHPHVLQPVELYKGKYIYYSLGNFIFDQPWPDTKQSVLVHMQIELEKRLVTMSTTTNTVWSIRGFYPDIVPLKIVQFQPQKTTTLAETKAIFDVLKIPRSIVTLGSEKILIEKVTTVEAQKMGLSGRFILPVKTGMLFVFETPMKHGIWMKDMRFPIDIYWFDKDFKLIDNEMSVNPNTYPNVFYPDQDGLYVLETLQGQLDIQSLTKDLTGELTDSHTYDKN